MQSQVIVPLDGSTDAEAILPHALFYALQTQSLLTLLRVIMPPGEPEYPVPYIPDDWYEGEISWTMSYLIPSCDLSQEYERMRKSGGCSGSRW